MAGPRMNDDSEGLLEKLIAVDPATWVAAWDDSANSNVTDVEAPDEEVLNVTVMVSPSAGKVVTSSRPADA